MNRTRRTILGLCAVSALAFSLGGGVAAHPDGKPGEGGHHHEARTAMPDGLAVEKAWARASAGAAANGGAYLTVLNGGKEADRLVAAEATVSRHVEIHTHLNEDGVMRMRKVEGIDVPAGEAVTMKPGGYHIMLIGLEKPLKTGETFPLTLVFEKAGKKTVEVTVMGVGTMSPDAGNGHGHGHH